ncbi:MAG: MOSC domain-containing protein, partial [Solirubrobacterales bacterium]|nr:MOSC domain-containing protein [Solirubrobacterales bacterium]
LGPAAFGENLSLRGVEVSGARIGERWRGSALLEVRQPRLPCFKLGLRHEDPLLPQRFARAGRPGAYPAIIEPGMVTPGTKSRSSTGPTTTSPWRSSRSCSSTTTAAAMSCSRPPPSRRSGAPGRGETSRRIPRREHELTTAPVPP